jgi:hypothetical protein
LLILPQRISREYDYRIINETNLKNLSIKELSKTKYRVLLGPFNDIKKLEDSFNEIKKLNFENLEIVKNV